MNPRAIPTAIVCFTILTGLLIHPTQTPSIPNGTKTGTGPLHPAFSLAYPRHGSGNITDPSLTPDKHFPVAVNIAGAPEFNQYSFTLEYNYKVLQVDNATLGGTVLAGKLLSQTNVVTVISGRIEAFVYGNESFSGDGTLLLVSFKVLIVSLSVLSLTDTSLELDGSPISHVEEGGCFNNRPPRVPMVSFTSNTAPDYSETSLFLIGRVSVGIILPESEGPSYNWTDTQVNETITGIKAAMSWWASQAPRGSLEFSYNTYVRVPTSYEPIKMPFGNTTWITDVMTRMGFGGDAFTATRALDNEMRTKDGTDWAFTIFVADNEYQGFQNRTDYAYANIGGPFLVMARYSTYASNSGLYSMTAPAHETGHIFGATDEYDDILGYSGYLYTPDAAYSTGIMNRNDLKLSVSSRAQVGLIDCNGNGIPDLVEEKPVILMNSPPTSILPTVTEITGRAIATPYPSYLPGSHDVTVSKILKVEYEIDAAQLSNPETAGGVFGHAVEDFSFRIPSLPTGVHTIRVEAVDSFGNIGTANFSVDVHTS